MNRSARIMLILVLAAACSSDSELRPFTSDGCSLFPDASQITRDDWCSCCFSHDVSYWRGGTREEREEADLELKRCVQEKTGNAALATMMYEGVRFGGSPYFYNWYRWGYGWSGSHEYRALTDGEHRQADRLLEQYLDSASEEACAK